VIKWRTKSKFFWLTTQKLLYNMSSKSYSDDVKKVKVTKSYSNVSEFAVLLLVHCQFVNNNFIFMTFSYKQVGPTRIDLQSESVQCLSYCEMAEHNNPNVLFSRKSLICIKHKPFFFTTFQNKQRFLSQNSITSCFCFR
jgi:hypothetical protein